VHHHATLCNNLQHLLSHCNLIFKSAFEGKKLQTGRADIFLCHYL
jgi:Na+/alanine symporter